MEAQTNRSVQHFMKVEYSLKEERMGWWEGPLLTLPGQLKREDHVRDKNCVNVLSEKHFWFLTRSPLLAHLLSVFCLFPENLLLFFHVCFPEILCSEL